MKPGLLATFGAHLAAVALFGMAGCSGKVQSDIEPPEDAAVAGADTGTPPVKKLDAAPAAKDTGGAGAPDAAASDNTPDAAAPVDLRRDTASVVTPPSGDGGVSPNPPAGPAGPWARNLRVGLVEVSQGVFVKIGEGNMTVAAGMRNAPLVEGRPMFARVHVATEQGFTARRLRAVLSLEYGDGTKYEIEDAKMISGASNPEQLATTFNFLVPAGNVKPDAKLAASVYETDMGAGAEPASPPRFPAMGTADLAVKAGKMELHVVAIPSGMLMDTPERRKKLTDDIYDLYPVQKVNLTVHAPVTIEGAFSSTKGFALLRDLREMENAGPHQYYHLIIRATGVGYAGVASRAGAGMNDGSRRVGITIVRTATLDGNTNTAAHEIGHNHGRLHTPGCGAAGPDAMYPYTMPAGGMGVNGFSLSTNTLKSKVMFRDLMSYCRPRWISDYVWRAFEERVRIVSGYIPAGGGGGMNMLPARSLQGFAGPGEAPNWGIVAGSLVEDGAVATASRHAVLKLADGRQVRVPVAVEELTDHETREFAVNLLGDDYTDADVLEVEVVIDGQRSTVPVSAMFRHR